MALWSWKVLRTANLFTVMLVGFYSSYHTVMSHTHTPPAWCLQDVARFAQPPPEEGSLASTCHHAIDCAYYHDFSCCPFLLNITAAYKNVLWHLAQERKPSTLTSATVRGISVQRCELVQHCSSASSIEDVCQCNQSAEEWFGVVHFYPATRKHTIALNLRNWCRSSQWHARTFALVV
eukprot:4548530-Amphidinium_carterae.1